MHNTWNSAAPEGVHGVLDQTTTQPKKVYYKGIYITFDVSIQHGRDFASFSQALSFAYRVRTDRQTGPKSQYFFPKTWFFAVRKKASKFEGKKCEKMRKSLILGSQKWWFFALFLKKSILRKLVFRLDGSTISGVRTPPKTVKNRWKNHVIFGHRIFRVFSPICAVLGSQNGPKNGRKINPGWSRKRYKNRFNFLTTFWKPQGSILGDLGTILGDFLGIWGLIWGDFQQNGPPTWDVLL